MLLELPIIWPLTEVFGKMCVKLNYLLYLKIFSLFRTCIEPMVLHEKGYYRQQWTWLCASTWPGLWIMQSHKNFITFKFTSVTLSKSASCMLSSIRSLVIPAALTMMLGGMENRSMMPLNSAITFSEWATSTWNPAYLSLIWPAYINFT